MMILLPLMAAAGSASNNPVDALLASTRVLGSESRPAWRTHLEISSEHVMARLRGLKAEIHADMCRRGGQRYCLGGICLPLPDGCAKE
jgi:hypothetical protein